MPESERQHQRAHIESRRFAPPRLEMIALGLLIAGHAVINLHWLRHNTAPMAHWGDPYVYLVRTLRFIDSLPEVSGVGEFCHELLDLSFGGRPILYQLLSVPFIKIFGRSEEAALYINIVFNTILILSTYAIARRVQGSWAGLLAAVVVTSYPPIIHLSHIYRPHSALPACVATSIWVLLRLLDKRCMTAAGLFAASLAFGFLIHPKFLWALAAPTAVFGIYLVFFKTDPKWPSTLRQSASWFWAKIRDPFVWRGLLPGGLLALAIPIAWLLAKRVSLAAIPRIAVSILELFAGPTGSIFMHEREPSFWWYLLTAPDALSNALTALMVLGIATCILKRRLMHWALVFTLMTGYTAWSLYVNLSWWYFASVLPIAAAVTAVGIDALRSKWLSTTLYVLCMLVAVFNFSTVTWGTGPRTSLVAMTLGLRPDSGPCRASVVFCPAPARPEIWPVEEALRIVLDDPQCQPARPCRLTVESRWVWIFRYYLVRHWPDSRLVIQPLNMPSREVADYDYSQLLEHDYLMIMFLRDRPAGTHNPASPASSFISFLNSPPMAFTRAHEVAGSFQLPDGRRTRLLKRVIPLTDREIMASTTALTANMELARLKRLAAMTPSGLSPRRQLATIHLSQDNFEAAINMFQEILEINSGSLNTMIALGRTYHRIGKHQEALKQLEKARVLAPDDSRPQVLLAAAHFSLGEREKGIQKLQEALEINPQAVDVRLKLGRIYSKVGRITDATTQFEHALALAPADARPRISLGTVYLSQGRPEAAITMFRGALRNDPTSVDAKVGLGKVYYRSGRHEEAVAPLEEAMTLAPEDPRPRKILRAIDLARERG